MIEPRAARSATARTPPTAPNELFTINVLPDGEDMMYADRCVHIEVPEGHDGTVLPKRLGALASELRCNIARLRCQPRPEETFGSVVVRGDLRVRFDESLSAELAPILLLFAARQVARHGTPNDRPHVHLVMNDPAEYEVDG
jgi:hypothetical protein